VVQSERGGLEAANGGFFPARKGGALMRRLLLLLLAACCAFAATPGRASAQWSENFDSYVAGTGVIGQGGWQGWEANPAADAYVFNLYSFSNPNSVEITAGSDFVHRYTGITSGVWIYTAWQYVPENFSGQTYFLLLNTYNDEGPHNSSVQVSMSSTTNQILSENDGGTRPLIRGRWVELRDEIDLVSNTQTFYYDGLSLQPSVPSPVKGTTWGKLKQDFR
jgi:hypothetical protein